MPANLPAQGDKSYPSLLKSIKSALSEGLINVPKALEYQRVRTYWRIGERISSYRHKGKPSHALTPEDLCECISRDVRPRAGGIVLIFQARSRVCWGCKN